MYSTSVRSTVGYSPFERTVSMFSSILPEFLSNGVLAGAMRAVFDVGGEEVGLLAVHLAVVDTEVRRLEEAELVHLAYVDSDEMRPMFGPSGVSMGHTRP